MADARGAKETRDGEDKDAQRNDVCHLGNEDTAHPIDRVATLARRPFEIESFLLQLTEISVSNAVVEMINDVRKSGIRFSHLSISSLWLEQLERNAVSDFLSARVVSARGIQSLTIDLGGFDALGVQALCTAITHSQSLRELEFRMDEGVEDDAEPRVWWP